MHCSAKLDSSLVYLAGRAQVSAWSGDLASAEQAYHQLLTRTLRISRRGRPGIRVSMAGREA
ncbi:MAG TPA: hypothetical protein VKB22_09185, partial [Gemmatimonadales bacterium]|nr:hypothetical protein [Gemmatimonadales bacterium]